MSGTRTTEFSVGESSASEFSASERSDQRDARFVDGESFKFDGAHCARSFLLDSSIPNKAHSVIGWLTGEFSLSLSCLEGELLVPKFWKTIVSAIFKGRSRFWSTADKSEGGFSTKALRAVSNLDKGRISAAEGKIDCSISAPGEFLSMMKGKFCLACMLAEISSVSPEGSESVCFWKRRTRWDGGT